MAKKNGKAPVAAKPKKITAAKKPRSKSELYAALSDYTTLSKKQVASVFDGLGAVFAADLGKNGPRILNVPQMMKVYVRRVPAKPAREGVNPRTGEKMMYKAKPARDVVKVRALKMLKELVA
ncbi:MAG: HU family DNA-binding protein [Phycisphaerales bacterium]